MSSSSNPPGSERRVFSRYPTALQVDYTQGENFLFSNISNISEMGIFIYSNEPLPVGTKLTLRFGPDGQPPLELNGEVMWINPYRADGNNINPGMGVRFTSLKLAQREQIVQLMRTIAYLDDEPN